ncbi:MAG TPA: AAA family ATPase [Thiotrichales bacterium]|nr:AAA family ATPase [Thiotrichales bacterium]
MYTKYFRLEGRPFSIAPDPRFLYLSERHREALAHLLYGLEQGGGFVQLTGEVGTGKTTLCRAFLEQLPSHVDVAFIVNPRLDERELLATICDELGIEHPGETAGLRQLVDSLNRHLLDSHARGRRTVLVVDEAQNLSAAVLEQIRLLTNLETPREKLLQIVLIGQPELKDLLERQDLRQLAQRITARYHLEPLDREETRAYIRHRLRVCGTAEPLFTQGAMDEAWRLTGGIPRLVNILCDRALLGAYVEEAPRVDRRILRRAAAEVLPGRPVSEASRPRRRWPWAAGLAALALLVLGYVAIRGADLPAWLSSPLASHEDPPGQPQALPPSGPAGASTAEETAEVPAATAPPPVPQPAQTEAVVPGTQLPEGLPEALEAAGEGAGVQAWDTLFRHWGVAYFLDDPAPACEQAAHQGLRCLTGSGSWAQLIALDRPAVIELRNDQGRQVPVVLESVADGQARIELAGQGWTVPVEWLRGRWFGRFSLLWKPAITAEVLKEGDRGLDVLWLRRRLADWQPGGEAPADPQFFDSALAARLRAFQAAQGLVADGVAGARTLIRLNSLAPAEGRPLLLADSGESH